MNTTSNNDINYQSNDNLQFPEIGSPSVGPYISPTFNQNLSYNDQIYGTMVCYNCLSVLLIRHDWNYAKCGECQKINKIPHRNISSNQNSNYNIYNNSNNFYDDSQNMSDLLGDIPYVYGIVNCPFCSTENKIRKDSKRITCYNCANSFNVNGYTNSQNPKYVKEKITKVIHTGEYIPVYQNNNNHCNCTNTVQLFILDKILNELKEKKKPRIAYPTIFYDPFGFHYREINTPRKIIKPFSFSQPKIKKESHSNGFRITIKKLNKNENGNNNLSKSASSVEKVFFTNKLKNDINKRKDYEY